MTISRLLLSAFAPDLVEGAWVERGQLIGFVGTTGRSNGPHLHFELQHNGVPTNPVVYPAIRRLQMRGGDLARFRRLVARDLEEARRDCDVGRSGLSARPDLAAGLYIFFQSPACS